MLFKRFAIRYPFEYLAAFVTFKAYGDRRMTDAETDENPSPGRITRLGHNPRVAPRVAAPAFFLISIFGAHIESRSASILTGLLT